MTLEVYLRSFGPESAVTEPLLIALGAERDDLGAWQVDLGDGAAAEISGLGPADEKASGGRSALVRLSGLTKRGADLLYALARSGGYAVIVPDAAAAGHVQVILPGGMDAALLPQAPPYGQAQKAESPDALFASLAAALDLKAEPGDAPGAEDWSGAEDPGWLGRLLRRLAAR